MVAQLERAFVTVLPAWRHCPGRTKTADHPPLDAAKASVPAHFTEFVPFEHTAFQYGITLHDSGYFWEAHEVWEAVWIAAPQNGRDRIALRALIQITNAGLKASLGKANAMDRLMRDAVALLIELTLRESAIIHASPADYLQAQALIKAVEEWSQNNSMIAHHTKTHSMLLLREYFHVMG